VQLKLYVAHSQKLSLSLSTKSWPWLERAIPIPSCCLHCRLRHRTPFWLSQHSGTPHSSQAPHSRLHSQGPGVMTSVSLTPSPGLNPMLFPPQTLISSIPPPSAGPQAKPVTNSCFSDGAGRTGTYILIDMVLNRMAKGKDGALNPRPLLESPPCPGTWDRMEEQVFTPPGLDPQAF
jgi:hypothetical protein